MNPEPIATSHLQANQIGETDFEKRRGISHVEVRSGLTQVHISQLTAPVSVARLKVLEDVSNAGISFDFLKLTPSGLSFIVPADKTDLIKSTLSNGGYAHDLATHRGIVSVHAVNMRDEEGMIAGILRRVIGAGIVIDHVTDMHDRILVVTEESSANKFKALLEQEIANV